MGKIHDIWKKAKGELRPDQIKALPKEAYGDKMDTYEKLCEKIAAECASLDKHLTEVEALYIELNETMFEKYTDKIRAVKPKPSAKFEEELGNLIRGFRGWGAKAHQGWKKVKDAPFGVRKF